MRILFALLFSAYLFASPQGVPLPPTIVTVGTSSTQIVAKNQYRAYLLMQNQGASTVQCYVSLSGPITANQGLLVLGGQNWEVLEGFSKSAAYGMCSIPTTFATQEINY